MSFGPADLGCTTPLFSHFDHGLSHPATDSDPVVAAAMAAANKCYTPYTASPAGVTLQGILAAIFLLADLGGLKLLLQLLFLMHRTSFFVGAAP